MLTICKFLSSNLHIYFYKASVTIARIIADKYILHIFRNNKKYFYCQTYAVISLANICRYVRKSIDMFYILDTLINSRSISIMLNAKIKIYTIKQKKREMLFCQNVVYYFLLFIYSRYIIVLPNTLF